MPWQLGPAGPHRSKPVGTPSMARWEAKSRDASMEIHKMLPKRAAGRVPTASYVKLSKIIRLISAVTQKDPLYNA